MPTLAYEDVRHLAHRVSVVVRSTVPSPFRRDEVEDLVRMALWEQQCRDPGWAPCTAWMRTVARRAAHKVSRRRELVLQEINLEAVRAPQDRAVIGRGRCEGRSVLREYADRIRASLSPRQWKVYCLCLRGTSCRRIARLCRICPVDVRHDLRMAATKLREIVGTNPTPAQPLKNVALVADTRNRTQVGRR